MNRYFLWRGQPIPFHKGETIASALSRLGIHKLGEPTSLVPRQLFCGIGQCQNCLIRVDGVTTEACLAPCQEGLRAEPETRFCGDQS
jgi:aerobic-type carbon monoxide dehydrogenase small subunit (CoxS/CutS family)